MTRPPPRRLLLVGRTLALEYPNHGRPFALADFETAMARAILGGNSWASFASNCCNGKTENLGKIFTYR
eukprot:11211731-Lingulodinium_polyedra.AAC.1